MIASAIIAISPVQEYEETLVILGVYPTIERAKADVPRLRSLPYAEGGRYDPAYGDAWRDVLVQHWQGDRVIEEHLHTVNSGWIS